MALRISGTLGALLAAMGVAAGAFGAHALQGSASAPEIEVWRTGANYLLLTGIGIVALSFGPSNRIAKSAGACLAAGAVVFAGSLFAIVLTGVEVLGAVTPIGGLLMIVGWVFATLAIHRGTIEE